MKPAMQCLLFCVICLSGCSNRDDQGSAGKLSSNTASDHREPIDESTDVGEQPVTCRVRLDYLGSENVVEFKIRDSSKVEALVLSSLRSAEVDKQPARYEILGTLTLERGNKKIEEVVLFLPIGRVRRNGTYLVAEFSELQEYLTSQLSSLESMLPALRRAVQGPS